jgi:tetratricopeptide (TPR) repeat protein/predicted small secreted protein
VVSALRRPATCVAALLLAATAVAAQSTVQGVARDSQSRPVAGATIQLRMEATGKTLTTQTDSKGGYRFSALHAGAYTLHAQSSVAGEAAAGPFTVGDAESKTFDLKLEYAFFDKPGFIVAGVTDSTAHGGHGSDVVQRSAESLTKATASLGGSSSPAARNAENQGHALEAVHQYQRAAELDPSEANLFDWAAELLTHRAFEPAAEIFAKGNRLYPRSLRMLLGLATAWYARGSYDHAAKYFFQACDLDPGDPEPYLFLGKVQSSEITQSEGYVERLERFAQRHPENAWANYYYALGLWKQRKPEDAETPARVLSLLQKAIRIDPLLGAAQLQIGIVYSAQNDYPRAIAAYRKAIEASPGLDEAHYRLGQTYERTGDAENARKELATYAEMSKKSAEEAQRERSEIQQFVIDLRGSTTP